MNEICQAPSFVRADHFTGIRHDYAEELDRDHGRLEIRRYSITEDLRTLSDTGNGKGLLSIGRVEREYLQGDTQTLEQRYSIDSIPPVSRPFWNQKGTF